MTQEFVTLPREVAERALKSMMDARCSVYDGFEYDKAATAFAAALEQAPALDQPQANHPAMTPIAQRKLDSLLAEGYTISGYSVYHERKHQHGFVTGAGLVGWWRPEGVEYPQPQGEQAPSPTAGMNIAQRILHVGGRNNAAGYVEFGSIQAVEALVRQVLRDFPQPKREPLTNEQVKAGLIQSIEYTDARERCAFNIGVRFAERAHGIK